MSMASRTQEGFVTGQSHQGASPRDGPANLDASVPGVVPIETHQSITAPASCSNESSAVFVTQESHQGASPRDSPANLDASVPGVVPIEIHQSIAAPASCSNEGSPVTKTDGVKDQKSSGGTWKGPDVGNWSVSDGGKSKKSERRTGWKGPDVGSEGPVSQQLNDVDGAGSMFSANQNIAAVEEYDSDNESLNEIKARTMYRMVEEIVVGGTKYKLLFLTNRQAQLLSTLEGSIKRVFDAFEIKTPKLVLNLIASQGVPSEFSGFGNMPIGPYATKDEMYRNDEFLVEFMRRVVVPMAIETNAIVLVEACGWCRLAVAFGKAVHELKAKWPGGKPPFTTLGFTGDINFMYTNSDTDAFWKKLRMRSKAWKARDDFIKIVSSACFTNPASKLQSSRGVHVCN